VYKQCFSTPVPQCVS